MKAYRDVTCPNNHHWRGAWSPGEVFACPLCQAEMVPVPIKTSLKLNKPPRSKMTVGMTMRVQLTRWCRFRVWAAKCLIWTAAKFMNAAVTFEDGSNGKES